MGLKRMNKLAATALTAVMVAEAGLTSFVPLTAEAKKAVEKEAMVTETAVNADTAGKTAKFTWDNVTAYFVLTDRFLNADTSNDHSYGRGLQADGKTPVEGLDTYTNPGTFHGGDLKGLTQKVKEGYFNDIGVNAIWITAPYEQIHGYTSGNVQSNNANTYPDPAGGGFPYYSYHGYWTLDYTNIDANMGDEADFGEFVDSCHEKGIRVIMDVVMNHVGYTTMQDAVDYGFDSALKSGWQSYYYGNATHLMGGDPESTTYWDAKASVWASKWWGPGFVRANYPGYEAAGGGDERMSLCGLPDVMTESSASEVSTPPLLVTKWTQEGRLEQEQKELDEFFSKNGYKKQARYYIIKWLTDWVREYGVDGYRCDTAKHVSLDAWNDLKKEAVKALEEWRQNNPDKPGADWTDEFWMTGECWGHGMSKSPYHEAGGFDSMINFGFPKNGDPANMEGTYSAYAAINDDPEWNTLSYINSHDDNDGAKVTWNISTEKMMQNGTCLLLSPGGVQIYYGNEINRGLGWTDFFTGTDYLDQRFRTDMDWVNYDKVCLAHWQKVGQFRNNHPAVGAGQHEKLEGDVYTFSRTYHLEEEDEDKVVVALPQKAGTFSVSVGEVFEEGETLTDAYSGKTYVVTGGAVEATTADANSPILLQGSGIVKPSVNAKAKNGDSYKTETLNVTLKANRVTDAYYSVDGGPKIPYKSNDVITIGGDTAYGEVTTLTVEGVSEEDGTTKITKIITYKRSEEPVVSDGIRIEASKSDFPTAPNAFVYMTDEAETPLNGAWPGGVMEDDGDCWVYTNDEAEGPVRVIFSLGASSNTGGTWRSTPDKAPGLLVNGGAQYTKDSEKLTEIPVGVPGKVYVKYVDAAGNVLKSIYRVGAVGKPYKTYPADIAGYTLVETPANATGTFEAESTVTYVYSGSGDITPVVTKPAENTPTPTVEPTKPGEATPTVEPTKPGEATPTPTVEPTKPGEATPTPTPVLPPTEEELMIDGFSVTGDTNEVKLTAYMMGETGKSVRYMYTYEKDGKEVLIANFQPKSAITWIPKAAGKYTFNLYVIHNGKIQSTSTSYTVR